MDANKGEVSLQPVDIRSEDKSQTKIVESINHEEASVVYTLEEVKSKRRRTKPKGHKYRLVLPDPLWTELQRVIRHRHIDVSDFINRAIESGIVIARIEELEPGATINIRREGMPDEKLSIVV